MSKAKQTEITHEVDLKEVFLTLCKGWYIILAISILAVVFSSMYLRNSDRMYTVQAVYKPVGEGSGSPNLSGFSGLASLAGVSLPTSSSSDFITYQKLIFSEEVAKRVFINEELILKLFVGEWNSDSGSFKAPLSNQVGDVKQLIKSVLTGIEKQKYISPNPKRLSILAASILTISLDGPTGFLSVSAETNKPDIILELILNVAQETDNLLKERFLASAEETLDFYHQKLLTSRSPEHREALAKLISAEDKKLMLASKSSNFVAEPLTTPTVSLYPTSPNPSLVLGVGFVLGFFLGMVAVLAKKAMAKPRDN